MSKQIFSFYPSIKIISILLIMILLSGCNPNFSAMADKRVEIARKNAGVIKIVAVKTLKNSNYINGVLLAEREINNRPNKLIGRPLKIEIVDDGKTFEDVKYTIRRIVSDPRVTAVLGHRASKIAIPASVIYELSQVVFLPSFATSKALTGHNFKYLFRMAPSSQVMAEQTASAAKILGYKKIALLYGRDDLNKEFTFLFEKSAIEQGIEIVNRASFFEKDSNYRPIIAQLSNLKIDAILVASGAMAAGKMTKQLREMGMMQPILGNDNFFHQDYLNKAGIAAENTIVPSLYRPDTNAHAIFNKIFTEAYQKAYKKIPDYNAAQGYDSVMLMAHAIELTGSTLPSALTSTLHYMPAWMGVTGLHSFDEYGEVYGKKYVFSARKDGDWHYLPALHAPYLLSRFTKKRKEIAGDTNKVENYLEIFKKRMHADDRKAYLIDLAHEIIQFKQLGIIYEDTKFGRKTANYDIAKSVADKKGFKIVSCKIPFSILSIEKIKSNLIACYGKLPLQAQAILISSRNGIDKNFIHMLNKNLFFFKIPTISLDTQDIDANISLSLDKRQDLLPLQKGQLEYFNGLLSGLKLHEFSQQLIGLPGIIVNMRHMRNYDISEQGILQLSPDSYSFHDKNTHIKGNKM